jgi:hypothetical protein
VSTATISTDYLWEQQRLHSIPSYGTASSSYAPLVKKLIRLAGADSVSDYGAGKQNLKTALDRLGLRSIDYRPYDPVFPEYGPPRPADIVCCIDVLEHIEPDLLAQVLDDLGGIVVGVGLFTVHTGPAVKTLSDGRNAHIIQQPQSWWLPRLSEHFEIRHLQTVPNGFLVVVEPRGASLDPRLTPGALNRMSREVEIAIDPYPHSRVKSMVHRIGLMNLAKRAARTLLPASSYKKIRAA